MFLQKPLSRQAILPPRRANRMTFTHGAILRRTHSNFPSLIEAIAATFNIGKLNDFRSSSLWKDAASFLFGRGILIFVINVRPLSRVLTPKPTLHLIDTALPCPLFVDQDEPRIRTDNAIPASAAGCAVITLPASVATF